jgi:signal transduction histidine kinase
VGVYGDLLRGPIEVIVSTPAADTAQIVVQDHGLGVPVARRPHLFNQFYQAHSEGHFGGMGLGPYISREIIELHGGGSGLNRTDG